MTPQEVLDKLSAVMDEARYIDRNDRGDAVIMTFYDGTRLQVSVEEW